MTTWHIISGLSHVHFFTSQLPGTDFGQQSFLLLSTVSPFGKLRSLANGTVPWWTRGDVTASVLTTVPVLSASLHKDIHEPDRILPRSSIWTPHVPGWTRKPRTAQGDILCKTENARLACLSIIFNYQNCLLMWALAPCFGWKERWSIWLLAGGTYMALSWLSSAFTN